MMSSWMYGDPELGSGLALGVTLAQVSQTDDPAGAGCIKVKFIVEGEADGGSGETDWISVMSPFAGNAHGAFFLPQKGDLALVAFGNGDPSKPYVLGFLWNGTLKPPVPKAQQTQVRMIRTVQGKVITFDDFKNGQLTIADEKKNRITLDTAKNSITIESQGDLTITAKGTISLAGAEVVIQTTDASVTMSVASEGIELDGADSIKLSAGMIDIN